MPVFDTPRAPSGEQNAPGVTVFFGGACVFVGRGFGLVVVGRGLGFFVVGCTVGLTVVRVGAGLELGLRLGVAGTSAVVGAAVVGTVSTGACSVVGSAARLRGAAVVGFGSGLPVKI
ncbi:hypothetical protein M1L60_10975 [Actinoplanes sp. TRM 88003]|uniref:Uncharacterized protein n=1 Tax=Paractinoplanes aksuensis TaxID=2939490 RepID=A0ABT1DJW8_9ACTN|nr:hypothetical protein [Actinoplanes aksuensis]MCO8271115.1 hypothetical protein [Actinoplanes aksuensis]